MNASDVVVVVPTKREPPINTLKHYHIGARQLIVVADPDVYHMHRRYYGDDDNITVVKGESGLAPQIAACYRAAWAARFPWWFRLDDDLAERTFVHRNGQYPSLEFVIICALRCARKTGTTLTGFMNGANRYWMGKGYARTYGLIHGGAQLVRSTKYPEKYVDIRLQRYEDVYRSCAHREEAGAVGRVRFIGFDKSKSSNARSNQSSIQISDKKLRAAKRIVLEKWPDFVTCNGTRRIHNGEVEIANWRMKRHPDYTP